MKILLLEGNIVAQGNRCKNCGGILLISPYSKQAECENCGSTFELDDNRGQFSDLYSRADDAWGRKDFDEAIRFYHQIVNEDNTQSEAHWGIALCRYGIGYELDPIKYVQMPTCNRINRTSIFNDKNYLAAIKYAGESAKANYMQRANEIDRISKDFLKIVDQEKPYDVFISYKRTDANGIRTRDSEYAKKLYMFLTEKGVRVFFAEVSLRAVAGEKYEPYIFAALNSARVMVLFGSSREYIEATWVKNEWRRFLILSHNDPNKSLIPAYIGGDPYKVFPQELLGIQSYDVGSPVFVDEIYETVKKKLSAKEKVQGGQTLQAKYASKETVMKLVNELDCDPKSAVEALVLMQGDIGKTKDYLRSEPEYKKNYWKCVGCGANNTHDVCHNPNCNTTKVQSLDIEAKRKAYEAKKKSQAALKKSQSKVRGAIKSFVTNHKKLTIAIIALVVFLMFRGTIGALLYSCSSDNDGDSGYTPSGNIEGVGKDKDLYTPQLINMYGGTYKSGSKEREAVLEITACSESGSITGTFSFFADGAYGKYTISGQIIDKAKNGNCDIEIEPGMWVVQPSNYSMLDKMTIEVTQNCTQMTSSSYSLSLSTAEGEKFMIKSAADLQKLNNSAKPYFLANDIDLGGAEWTPIEGFTGSLSGNGHTIKNFTINASSDNVGFFSVLEGSVTNLKLENAKINVSGRHENVGVLCGQLAKGSISDIHVSGSVEADTCTNVGGIVGNVVVTSSYNMSNLFNSASVIGLNNVGGIIGGSVNSYKYSSDGTVSLSQFENSANIVGKGSYVGGIIGYLTQDNGYDDLMLYASNMKNTGDVSGKTYVGGIFGYAQSDSLSSYMQDCTNQSVVTAESYVGCIAGQLTYITITDCSNSGSSLNVTGHTIIDGEKYAYAGGYVGYGYLANDCTNSVEISYGGTGRYVGGVIGYTDATKDYSMTNLKNTANISGYSHVGGIIGGSVNSYKYAYEGTVSLSQLENSGKVVGKADYVAGIIGYLTQDNGYDDLMLYASDLKNTGDISGKAYVAGIFGYAKSDATTSYMQDCINQSTITGESYVGCIAGQVIYISITDCSNSGSELNATGYTTIEGEKYAYVGGYVGYGYLANNCTNEVSINYSGAGRYVGGILGYTDATKDYSMTNLKNTANISGHSYVGGIIGGSVNSYKYAYEGTVSLSQFENTAHVVGKGSYVGGIIGYLTQNNGYDDLVLYASEFVNTGSVSGGSYVGGIIGYAKSDSNKSSLIDCTTSTGSIAGQLESITIN